MEQFSKEVLAAMSLVDPKKYYVYRLIDPRTFQTFYVGKGCGNRVFQHAKEAKSLVGNDEDEISLKVRQIQDIQAQGKDVICMIHRWGLDEDTAFEVEAAVMDCYPGLTNIQSGHASERGAITPEDLSKLLVTEVYTEPEENYVIIKTTPAVIENIAGSYENQLYEATRQAWRASLDRARKYKYVLAVVQGIVKQVYEADRWYQVNGTNRIAFEGKPTGNAEMAKLKGKMIPDYYRQKGSASPFLYKK